MITFDKDKITFLNVKIFVNIRARKINYLINFIKEKIYF